jgi:hypothetical protein
LIACLWWTTSEIAEPNIEPNMHYFTHTHTHMHVSTKLTVKASLLRRLNSSRGWRIGAHVWEREFYFTLQFQCRRRWLQHHLHWPW